MSVVALMPAAGRGVRLGASQPKALVSVAGQPLLVHAVHGLLRSGRVDAVVVAAGRDQCATVREVLDAGAVPAERVMVVHGGVERSDSVRLALDAAREALADIDVVLVHDAARAFVPASVTLAVIAEVLAGTPAVIPVLPVADTIKRVDGVGDVAATVDRSYLRVVQTPQGFSPDVLLRAHRQQEPATDDAALVERLGIRVRTVDGHAYAMKITTPFDLAVAEAVLAEAEQVAP